MTTQTPTIRRAQEADAADLAACMEAAYARYAARIPDLPAVSEGCAEDIRDNQVWVALLGGEIIAGLVLVAGDGFMKLANLAVHPDHCGKGLGRELMRISEGEATKQGFEEMRLNTHVEMPANVRLYQHLGWVVVSCRGKTVCMRKGLPSD
ncbi:GNAT family N-acetyltransferase [Maricaulis maris]|uniref:GNAT family N-acetyltransferase n=1 Tax=Maricaulis maris TaxID=74318 RepID=UPI003B8C1405